MITRNDVLSQAVNECMKELYSLATPHIEWKDFIKECEIYSNLYKEWEAFNSAYNSKDEYPDKWEKIREKYKSLDWEEKSIQECIGPKPYEFYYLPKEIMKDVCDSYVYAYRINQQQELLDTIETLKNYCKEPIIDKYIEGKNGDPGHRGYEHPDNLEEEINTYLDLKFPLMDPERAEDAEDFENKLNIAAKELQDKFFEFLDMAGNFYNWNRDLNTFNMSVYLGASPCSSKEIVIKNWKEFKNKDIEINEEQIKKEYYGEELD